MYIIAFEPQPDSPQRPPALRAPATAELPGGDSALNGGVVPRFAERWKQNLTLEKTKAAYSGFPFGASFSLLASRAHIPINLVNEV